MQPGLKGLRKNWVGGREQGNKYDETFVVGEPGKGVQMLFALFLFLQLLCEFQTVTKLKIYIYIK